MKEQDLKNAVEKIKISNDAKMRILERTKNNRKEENIMKSRKKFVPIAIAATLTLGITAFAAVTHWSSGFLQKMNINGEQMERLQDSDSSLVAMPNVSNTHDGITVSTAQCLFDGNAIHISFYVDGYELDKTEEPDLEYVNIYIDGKETHNYGFSFFNGIDWSDREHPVMADGTPVLEDADGNYIPNYRIADGKMEINLDLSPTDENGRRLSETDFENKEIKIVMGNFGDIKGEWILKWNLGGFEKGREVEINQELAGTGINVTSAVLYPASAIIRMNFPMVEITDTGLDESGNTITYSDFAEPPAFVGVKLKDGTVYTDLFGGGSEGYENGNRDEFVSRISFSRIIDTNEIDSLLFVKNPLADGKSRLTENDCYAVKLK